MSAVPIVSAKLTVVFKLGELPHLDPARPQFVLQLGAQQIHVSINPKAARKLAAHYGGAVLQGRLVDQGGKLVLLEAGFTYLEPKPPEGQEQPT
jgi:hypothetical protein